MAGSRLEMRIPPGSKIDAKITRSEPMQQGMFCVYEGEWCGAEVLIKCIHSSVAQSLMPIGAEAKEKFHAECIKLGMAKHPNITLQLGVCEPQPPSTTSPGLVFEHMFCTLQERLSMPTPLERLGEVRIAKGVMAGLEYLHSKKWVYCNVCPKTIMLTSASPADCTAKLSDLMLVVKETSKDVNEDVPLTKALTQATDSVAALGVAKPAVCGFRDLAFQPPEVVSQVILASNTTPPESRSTASAQGSDFTGRLPADLVIRPSHDIFSYGVTMLGMCRREVFHVQPRSALQVVRNMEDATNDPHPLLRLIKECVTDWPPARPTAEQASAKLSRIVRAVAQSAANATAGPHHADTNQISALKKDIEISRQKAADACNKLTAKAKENGRLQQRLQQLQLEEPRIQAERAQQRKAHGGVTDCETCDTQRVALQQISMAREDLKRELASVLLDLEAAKQERDREFTRAEESKQIWDKFTEEQRKVREKDERIQRQLDRIEEQEKRSVEMAKAIQTLSAAASRDRQVLFKTLEKVACRMQFSEQEQKSASCCLPLGIPQTGVVDENPQWARQVGGRDAQLEDDIVHVSRKPCIHDGRVVTAVWKRSGSEQHTVCFLSSPLDNLRDWTHEVYSQTLPLGASPQSHQFDFVSHARQLYCLASSEEAGHIRLLRLQEAASSRERGRWVEVEKRNEYRAGYGVGVVGDELLIIGGTADNGAGVQEAKLNILALNLAPAGGPVSRWPALRRTMSCKHPDVVVDGKHVAVFNGARDGGRLHTTVLTLDHRRPASERHWTANASFSSGILAGCGVSVKNGYVVLAGGMEYMPWYVRGLADCQHAVKVYSGRGRRWIDLPPLTVSRTACALLADDERIVCLGGRSHVTRENPDGVFVKHIEVLAWPQLN